MLNTNTGDTTGIITVDEKTCAQLVGPQLAFDAVRDVFAAMARGDARNFPVVREALVRHREDILEGLQR